MKSRRQFLRLTALATATTAFLLTSRRKAKAVPPCGVLCAILVTVIILGVALVILVKVLKGCKKLKKKIDEQNPEDPDSVSLPAGVTLPPINHNGQTAWDISDLGYLDPNGNPYCVCFEMHVESAVTADGPWEEECMIKGYLSFTSVAVMQWNDTLYGGCYPSLMNGSLQPQGLRLKYSKAGVPTGTSFQPFSGWNCNDSPTQIIPGPDGINSRLFRVRCPSAD